MTHIPCPGCTGDYRYDHGTRPGPDGERVPCTQQGPIDECGCRAVETFVHDTFCESVGVLAGNRWPDRDNHHYSDKRWGF